MSHQDITKRVWTCDLCKIEVSTNYKLDFDLPEGWKCLSVEIPVAHGVHFERIDLCPNCIEKLDLATEQLKKRLGIY